jgi:hypothetical protein
VRDACCCCWSSAAAAAAAAVAPTIGLEQEGSCCFCCSCCGSGDGGLCAERERWGVGIMWSLLTNPPM